MYRYIFLVLLLHLTNTLQANKKTADSLSYEIINTTDKVEKAYLQLDYSWEIKYENLEECINSTNAAMEVLIKANFQPGISKGYSYLGVYKYLQDSIPEGISYLEKAEKMILTQDNPDLLARLYNNFGVLYSAMFDNETALSYYKKSLEIREQMGANVDISSNLINISTILYDEGRYEECIETNEQALIYSLKNDDIESTAVIYSNLGAANERLGNYNIAINYTLKALNLYQNEVKNEAAEARTYSNLGANYLSQKEITEAKYYFTLALEINERINHSSNLVVSYNNMAEIERLLKNYQKAEKYALHALELATELKYAEEKRISFEELSLIAEDQGDYKKGLAYYKLYVEISDSIIDINQSVTQQKLLAQNQISMEKIQETKNLALEEVFQKKVRLMYIFILLSVVFLIIWLLIINGFLKAPMVITASLTYLVPLLFSAATTMYILLLTTIPKTYGVTGNLLVLTGVLTAGTIIYLVMDKRQCARLKND